MVVCKQTDEHLVLGPKRSDELVALFCFTFGLLCLSIVIVAIVDARRIDTDSFLLPFMMNLGAPIGIVGGIMLWLQERLILDRNTRKLVLLRPLRKSIVSSFEDIIGVEVLLAEANKRLTGQCLISLRHGKPIRVVAGPTPTCEEMARLVLEFLNRPEPSPDSQESGSHEPR